MIGDQGTETGDQEKVTDAQGTVTGDQGNMSGDQELVTVEEGPVKCGKE